MNHHETPAESAKSNPYNINKFRIELTTAERATLKCERSPLHIVGDGRLGYQRKRENIKD